MGKLIVTEFMRLDGVAQAPGLEQPLPSTLAMIPPAGGSRLVGFW
jgi:hypothetical protein